MLFNSYIFIFAFLPVVLVVFYTLGHRRRSWALAWLILASLVFYAWWRPLNVLLITPSILINYGVARGLVRWRDEKPVAARTLLLAGIVFNLCFLGYFKYLNFFKGTINDVFGANLILTQVILPLGISFITFQKIGFLIDLHAGRIDKVRFFDYALFVLFFPQLIAGPIVHYREMMPQFHATNCRFNSENAAVGLTLFFLGLFKKLVFADSLAAFVSPIYAHVAAGGSVALIDAWIAAMGFMLQVYFDFSGYSDMAIGLARLFGIKLPINFNSPLRASSIIEFWMRWHMTLTRFLTAYIFNPLVLHLTRRRAAKRLPPFGPRSVTLPGFLTLLMFPTVLTMFLSGLWHGAGYTFICWGLAHGLFLTINHAWRFLRLRIWPDTVSYTRVMEPVGFLLTFFSVAFSMVLFRAPTLHSAFAIWVSMLGQHGVSLPAEYFVRLGRVGAWLAGHGVHPAIASGKAFSQEILFLGILLAIALRAPNTMQLLSRYDPALGAPRPNPNKRLSLSWSPSPGWAVGTAVIAAAGILSLGQLSEFLYWQF
jgi:D-alanyl-lipoteichoic acid acyltransferase DltB (MBOAT superfamily)